jgi:hypothetical protein
MGGPGGETVIDLSVQPVPPVPPDREGAAAPGGAHRGLPVPRDKGAATVVNLHRLRVGVATPDAELGPRVAALAEAAGHDVVLVTDAPFDAMEAAFSKEVEVLILDQEIQRLAGTEIAALVRSVSSAVDVVVLHRGELASADDLLVLDPTRPGFDEALSNVLERLTQPSGERRTPPGPGLRAG